MVFRLKLAKQGNFCSIATAGSLSCLAIALVAPAAEAVTIVRNFVSEGDTFSFGGQASAVPLGLQGGGNLIDIFNTAADFWEAALPNIGRTFTIDFGWAELSGNQLGVATQFSVPQVLSSGGAIQFDSTGTTWFADLTPTLNEEFDTFTSTEVDLGGGPVNIGRVFSDPNTTAAQNFDLLTVAQHEIGHLLGIADLSGGSFEIPSLTIAAPLPNAGTLIPTTATGGGHIDLASALLFPTLAPGGRRLASEVDILASAQVDGLMSVNLDPTNVDSPTTAVPEPVTLLGTAIAIGLGTAMKRRNRFQRR